MTSIKNIPVKTSLFITMLVLSMAAQAVLMLEKSVSLSDEFGGTMHIDSSGQLDIPGAEIDSVASFTDFHPGAQDRSVNGQVLRHHSRSNEQLSSVYSGELTFEAADADGKPVQNVLEFGDLTIVRSEDGPQFSGSIILNGEVIDANEMPQAVARILRRVLRFFYLA